MNKRACQEALGATAETSSRAGCVGKLAALRGCSWLRGARKKKTLGYPWGSSKVIGGDTSPLAYVPSALVRGNWSAPTFQSLDRAARTVCCVHRKDPDRRAPPKPLQE